MLYRYQKGKYIEIRPLHLSLPSLKALSHAQSLEILEVLSHKEAYPLQISRELKIDMQKAYYFMRKQEKAGLIQRTRQEIKNGVVVNFYKAVSDSYYLSFLQKEQAAHSDMNFWHPFIKDGFFDARIIVGSPDPHGPEMARSRDGYYGIDLALYLGSQVTSFRPDAVKQDVEMLHADLSGNLILIGGPIVNKVTARVNDELPIRFDAGRNWSVHSTLSGKNYHADSLGIIVKCKNPFGYGEILVIAGKKHLGTKVVIDVLKKSLKDFAVGNKFDKKVQAHVVLGKDLDSDGTIDSFEILE